MEDEAYERLLCSYTNKSQRFLFKKKRKFDLQYSQLYAVRLMAMKQRLRTAAHKKWGDQVEIKQLANIKENEKCVIIGTIFRKMELQPSILKEISQEVYYFHFFFKILLFCWDGYSLQNDEYPWKYQEDTNLVFSQQKFFTKGFEPIGQIVTDYLTRMKEQRNIFFCGFSYFHWFLW